MLNQLKIVEGVGEKQYEHNIKLHCESNFHMTDYEVFEYITKAIKTYEKVRGIIYEVDAPHHSHPLL